jgi:hypothetical protein
MFSPLRGVDWLTGAEGNASLAERFVSYQLISDTLQ